MISKKWSKFLACSFAILTCALCVKPAGAQGGPPMITDDPATVGNGNWEINLLPSIEHTRGGSAYEAPNIDLNYGVGKRIQLKYEVPYVVVKDAGSPARSGFGNSNVGMRYRFIDQAKYGFSMSTYPALEFNNPTNSVKHGLADPGRRFFLPVEIAKDIGDVTANVEVGRLFDQHGANSWEYGLIVGRDVSERLETLVEVHGSSSSDASERVMFLNVGSRIGMTDHLTLLVSGGRSFRNPIEGPVTIGALGVQLTFGNGHEER
jgi:hypothetical protein